ncbi:hypothetical protein [Sporosarcina globispora]|nr:hypothetical protein [Sporosarcina globispora]
MKREKSVAILVLSDKLAEAIKKHLLPAAIRKVKSMKKSTA